LKIQKIKEDELYSLIDLYSHYIDSKEIPPLSGQTIQEIWKNIKTNPCVHYFCGKLENFLVASCILTITPSFIRGGKAFGVIEHVVVHSSHRRKGLAQELINFVVHFAWQNDCTEVMLLSGSQNTKAHQLYEKLGFDKNRKKGFILYKPD
jgi:GNAT superfamily N-acetyltransferase